LKRAIEIKEQIEALERDLGGILGASSDVPREEGAKAGRKKFSVATRRKMAAAQRARWAGKTEKGVESAVPPRKPRQMTAEGRARISAAAKARWAKVRRAGKTKL
jgi:hypothetical protein